MQSDEDTEDLYGSSYRYILLLGFGYVLPKNLILLNAVGFGIFFSRDSIIWL